MSRGYRSDGHIRGSVRSPASASRARSTLRLFVRLGLLFLLAAAEPAQGQWIEPPGHGWVQVTFFHHDTRKRFDPEGSVEPLFNEGGRSISTQLFLTGVAGLGRGVDVWVTVPFNRLAFNDVVDERLSTGFGDPRIHLRVGPELFGWKAPVPVAVRGGVKLPLGEFNRDAEIIPLSEGQRDWEVMLELGHSFWPLPLYAAGWAGYRRREVNSEIDRKPGDEWFGYAAMGGEVQRFVWKLAVDGLEGQAPVRRLPSGEVIPLVLDRRRLVQMLPSLGYRIGPGVVEIGGRLPIRGRNLPAGPSVFAGYFMRWESFW